MISLKINSHASTVARMAEDLAYSGIPLASYDRIAQFMLDQAYPAKEIGRYLDQIIERAGSIRRADFAPRRSVRSSCISQR